MHATRPDIQQCFEHHRRTSTQSSKFIFLLDGGTGEELIRRGVPYDRKIWSATALVNPQYHDVLKQVHLSFLQSGSNAITTNSFGVVPGVGFMPDDITNYVALSGKIARDAVTTHMKTGHTDASATSEDSQRKRPSSHNCYVLGSVGPLIESYRADLIASHHKGVEHYRRICQALEPYVDAFLAETMSCVDESLQVYDAVKKIGNGQLTTTTSTSTSTFSTTIPMSTTRQKRRRHLLISFTLNSNGNFRDSEPVCRGLKKLLNRIFHDNNEGQRKSMSSTNHNGNDGDKDGDVTLLAILFNCCEPEALTKALERIHKDDVLVKTLKGHNILLGAYANRLTAVDDQNWTLASSDRQQPLRTDLNGNDYWNNFVKPWINDYELCRIVGGCCGFSPEHIQLIHTEINKQKSNEN